MQTHGSEITRLRQQIDQEYKAARQGLSGFSSGTTRHDFIQAKTENIGKYHEQLIKLLGPEEAISITVDMLWSPFD